MTGLQTIVLLLSTVGISSLIACKTRTVSSLYIDDGYYVLEANSIMPATVEIKANGGSCSASAVSDTTLITAAHCVSKCDVVTGEPAEACTQGKTNAQLAAEVCTTLLDGKLICTREVYLATKDLDKEAYPTEREKLFFYKPQVRDHDLAVAIFPVGTFKYFYSLSPSVLASGSTAYIVGYSDEQMFSDDFSKRWGRIGVYFGDLLGRPSSSILSKKMMDDPTVAAISPGDSGGSLLNERCELAAVAARIVPPTPDGKINQHTNLNIKANLDFLTEVSAQHGAKFCTEPQSSCGSKNHVRPILPASPQEFPCRAENEAADQQIAEFVAKLKRERQAVAAQGNVVVHCKDQRGIYRSVKTKPICVTGQLVRRSEQTQVCNGRFVDTDGNPILVNDQTLEPSGRLYTDLAFDNPEEWRNDNSLLELACTSTHNGHCCMRPMCRKLELIPHNYNVSLGVELPCPASVRESPNGKLPRYLEDTPLLPPASRLETSPFHCDLSLSVLIRKKAGICFTLAAQQTSSTTRHYECFKVEDGRRTNRKIACPADLDKLL